MYILQTNVYSTQISISEEEVALGQPKMERAHAEDDVKTEMMKLKEYAALNLENVSEQ